MDEDSEAVRAVVGLRDASHDGVVLLLLLLWVPVMVVVEGKAKGAEEGLGEWVPLVRGHHEEAVAADGCFQPESRRRVAEWKLQRHFHQVQM